MILHFLYCSCFLLPLPWVITSTKVRNCMHWKQELKNYLKEPWFCVCICPTPMPLAGYDTRSIFKYSTAGWNSEFSFSLTGCLTKARELSLSFYLLLVKERRDGLMPFPRAFVQSENADSFIQDLNLGRWFYSWFCVPPAVSTQLWEYE